MGQPAIRGLLDTSVLIAAESGRSVDDGGLPEESVLSVVTVAELHAGVLAASDLATRARRMATIDAIADVTLLDVDSSVAAAWAHLRVYLANAGRRAGSNDLWIAATAVAHGLPLITQDDDFGPLDGVAGLTVIRV